MKGREEQGTEQKMNQLCKCRARTEKGKEKRHTISLYRPPSGGRSSAAGVLLLQNDSYLHNVNSDFVSFFSESEMITIVHVNT